MDKLIIKLKREQFRVSIRNQQLNQKFSERRMKTLLQQNSAFVEEQSTTQQILYFSNQSGFNFQNIEDLNNKIFLILQDDFIQDKSIYYQAVDILACEYQNDYVAPITQEFLEVLLKRLRQIPLINIKELQKLIKLFVNITYHLEWVCEYLVDEQVFQELLDLAKSNQDEQLISLIFSLLGNLIYKNSIASNIFLNKDCLIELQHKIISEKCLHEFLKAIRNCELNTIQLELQKMLLYIWYNKKDLVKMDEITVCFISLMNIFLTDDEQGEDFLFELDQSNILKDLINNLTRIQNYEELDAFLSFFNSISQINEAVLLNNGILYGLVYLLKKKVIFIPSLYCLIQNILHKNSEAFAQALIYGFLDSIVIAFQEVCKSFIYESAFEECFDTIQLIVQCFSLEFTNKIHQSKLHLALKDFLIDIDFAKIHRNQVTKAIDCLDLLCSISQQITNELRENKFIALLITISLEYPLHNELLNLITQLEDI